MCATFHFQKTNTSMVTWPSTRFQVLSHFHTSTSSSRTPTMPCCPPPPLPSSNTVDHHITARFCHQPCWPLEPCHWPHQCPSLHWRMWVSWLPHYALATTTTTMTTPCYRPTPLVKCHASKKEGMRRCGGGSGATQGSKIPTAALAMPMPYCKPICIGNTPAQSSVIPIAAPVVPVSTMGWYDIYMLPLPPH